MTFVLANGALYVLLAVAVLSTGSDSRVQLQEAIRSSL